MDEGEFRLAEYKALRDELLQFNTTLATTVNFLSVIVSAIFAFLFTSDPAGDKGPGFLAFFLPFAVILPSMYISMARLQGVLRIGAYIKVFLEREHELCYESHFALLAKHKDCKGTELGYRSTLFYLHLAFGAIVVAFFVLRGFLEWWQILAYVIVGAFYAHIAYRARSDDRSRYERVWQDIKKEASQADTPSSGTS